MTLAFLIGLQAAVTPAPPSAGSQRIAQTDFDLATYKPSTSTGDVHSLFACGDSTSSEIVVCARRFGRTYGVGGMARIFEAKPLRAEFGIGGGAKVNVHLEDFEFPNGQISHRVMVGIKLPF